MKHDTAQRPIFVRLFRSQEAFGVHRSTIYRWAQAGIIRIYKRGNISVVRVADVEAVLSGEENPEIHCGAKRGTNVG